tara:strand:- start:130 stop:234 length:105 start_codon:yes stop_codon:yes gene_type:complete
MSSLDGEMDTSSGINNLPELTSQIWAIGGQGEGT